METNVTAFIQWVAHDTREMLDEMTAFELHLCLCESDDEQTAAWWTFLNYLSETLDLQGLDEIRKHQQAYPSVCENIHKTAVKIACIAESPFDVAKGEMIRSMLESLASEVFEVENLANVALTSDDLI